MKEGYFSDSDIYTFSTLYFDCIYVVQSCCRWLVALMQGMYKYAKTNPVLFYIFLSIAIAMYCISVFFLQEKDGNDILEHIQTNESKNATVKVHTGSIKRRSKKKRR